MEALLESDPTIERRRWKRVAIVGAILLTGPILGMIGTVVGMIMSFQRIESMAAPTPGDLAQGVHLSLFVTAAGLLLGGIGAVLLTVGLVRLNGIQAGPATGSEANRRS